MTRRTALYPLTTGALVGLAVIVAYMSGAYGDTGTALALSDATPDVSTAGVARWWEDGRLAGVAAFGLFLVLKAAARWVPWLRRGKLQAQIAVITSAVGVLLPAAAQGTLTWGGLLLAVCASGYVLQPGGGERKGEQSGEIVATEGP